MQKKVVFLGAYGGVNKNNNQPYKRGYFYLDFDDAQKELSHGFRSTSFFIDDETFKQVLSIQPLSPVILDVRPLGNQEVVFSITPCK